MASNVAYALLSYRCSARTVRPDCDASTSCSRTFVPPMSPATIFMRRSFAQTGHALTSPEATRTVAGDPSEASDHRKRTGRIFHDPGRGHGENSRRLVFGTRLLPE